jgi:hypothetical protein
VSDYGDRVHQCDSCSAGSHADVGELLPYEWHRLASGQVVCDSCFKRPRRTYLTAAGWVKRDELLTGEGVLLAELWHDPQSERRWLELDKAFAEQQRRDGYDQMDLLGGVA